MSRRSAGTSGAIIVAPLVAIFTVALTTSVGSAVDSPVQAALDDSKIDDFGIALVSSFEIDLTRRPNATAVEVDCPEVRLEILIAPDGKGEISWYRTEPEIHGCMRAQTENADSEPFSGQTVRISRRDMQTLFSKMAALDWPPASKLASAETIISDYSNATCRLRTTALPSDAAGLTTETTMTLYHVYRAVPRAMAYSVYPDPSVDRDACRESANDDEEIIDAMLATLPIRYPREVIRR